MGILQSAGGSVSDLGKSSGVSGVVGGLSGYLSDKDPFTPHSSYTAQTPGINTQTFDPASLQFNPQLAAQQAALQQQLSGQGMNALGSQNSLAAALAARGNQTYGQQQNLISQLQSQSSGFGTSPAMIALQQQSQQNAAQGAQQLASQRGINPALAARMIGQNTAQNQQATAGQGALMKSQEQLAAQQQLGQILGQAQQLNVQGAGSNYGNVAQLGSSLGANMANTLGQQNIDQVQTMQNANAQQNQAINQGVLGAEQITGQSRDNRTGAKGAMGSIAGGIGDVLGGLGGGKGIAALAHGGRVPGDAHYQGDDLRNDTVPIKASPGEIVIPRSAAKDPKKAHAFLDQVMKGKGPKGYAAVLAAHHETKQSMARLEKEVQKLACGGQVRKMADGGMVEDDSFPAYDYGQSKDTNLFGNDYQLPPERSINPAASANSATPEQLDDSAEALKADPVPDATAAPAPEASALAPAADAAASAPSPTPAPVTGIDNALGEQKAGIKGAADAESAGAKDQADVLKKQADQIAALTQLRYEKMAAVEADDKKLKEDITSQKIDPNRFWNNMSTGNKVMAAIGIFLSGYGSRVNGGTNNPALEVINKAIERDVDAQKAELGKKQSLLNENVKRYGNIESAYAATALQLNTSARAQVEAIAAKTKGGVAQANAQVLMGQLDAQAAQYKTQLATSQTQQAVQGAVLSGKATLSPQLADQLYPGRWVNTPGGVQIARTKEGAQKVAAAQTSATDMSSLVGRMRDFSKNKAGVTGTWSGSDDAALGSGLRSQMVLKVKSMEQLGILSEGDMRLVEPLIPDPGSMRTARTEKQLDELQKFINAKVNAYYGSELINYNPSKIDFKKGA